MERYYKKEVYWCEILDKPCIMAIVPDCDECKYADYNK